MWKPTIEDKDHPYGEQGIRSSLDAVAQRAAKGAVDPRIRAWSIECLERARREGKKVGTERARAEILLAAVQKKLWVPDPVGTEFMAGAHLTACVDKDAPCFHGGDCFPEGTLVLRDESDGWGIADIEELCPGDRIWGLDDWSTVEAVVDKGMLSVDEIQLTNGASVMLTSGHKVYVRQDGEEKRLKVSELATGMVLSQPNIDKLFKVIGKGKSSLWKRARQRKQEQVLLQVRGVRKNFERLPCWDVQTSDHRVYLPEHDVTVSNCDDLVVLLASCFMSVGLHSMVVGHAYNQGKNIQHVLAAVRVDGKWQYADPSTDYPLEKCAPFTRERCLSVPNVQVICDETKCLSNPASFDPNEKGFVARGRFIGVDGVPETSSRVAWIGSGKKS